MKSVLETPKNSEAIESAPEDSLTGRMAVLEELDGILAGRSFKHADRCKQFLRYVVLSKLDGHTERLKERTIGTEVFQRPPGYATGEDPVVRVQAGEVRRRLDQHYQDVPQKPAVRIELPVGSYVPVFDWGTSHGALEKQIEAAHSGKPQGPRLKALIFATVAIVAAIGGSVLAHSLLRTADMTSAINQFWGPAIASHQPILICIANASDNPSADLKTPASQAESDASQSAVQAVRTSLPLYRDENPVTDPSLVSPEIVPAADASVAVALSGLFGKLNRPTQLRIGAAATYEDLRDFPSAVVGGFNNKWTMQLLSNLHFAFIWSHGQYMIREEIPGGKVWTTRKASDGETLEDFAIVGRLIDSKTGQFTVTVAGIGPRGTEAAGEFVSSPRDLEDGLAHAPAGWEKRNLEVLLQTTVTDSVAGPPHVIGSYAW